MSDLNRGLVSAGQRNQAARRRRWAVRSAFASVVLMASIILGGQAFAVHDLDLFELDRNATDAPATPGDDWGTLSGGGGSAERFTGVLSDVG